MTQATDYLAKPLKAFIDDLAARTPTPGGGSMAALVGSLAAAQAHMVVEYTVGKPRAAGKEERVKELRDEFRRAIDVFNQLMAEDMAAYERYAASRKSEDAAEREHAAATAVAVPVEIVVLAGAVAARLDEFKSLANPMLTGDLHAAAALAFAAAQSAANMARLNLASLTDRKEAERLDTQLDMLIGRAARHYNDVVHYHPA